MAEDKFNYKLSPSAKADILRYINVEPSNQAVTEYVSDKYGISISAGYISQIRKKAIQTQMNYYNKELDKVLTKKTRINTNLLDILDKSVILVKKYLDLEDVDLKDLMSILNTINRVYSEMNANTKAATSIDANIRKEAGLTN